MISTHFQRKVGEMQCEKNTFRHYVQSCVVLDAQMILKRESNAESLATFGAASSQANSSGFESLRFCRQKQARA
jgi:hypothetical protein